MTTGYPDWLRAFLLLGKHGTSYLPVLLDASGNLYAVFKGDKGAGARVNVKVDVDGQLIMVPRGQSGVYLAVDADGNLTTVIKGEYEGALRTVKLDDEGRLSAFVVDELDAWGQMLQVGNAELAARLGSPLSYDRRGQLLFNERFDHGMGMWSNYHYGSGAEVSLSPSYFKSGGYSLNLFVGADAQGYAYAYYKCGLYLGLRAGLGLFFSVVAAPSAIIFKLGHWDGTNMSEAALRYTISTSTIELRTTGGAWTTLTSAAKITAEASVFNYLKIVADFSTGYYARVLLNENLYDASAVPIYIANSPWAPYALIYIDVTSGLHATDAIYIDDIALTIQEP